MSIKTINENVSKGVAEMYLQSELADVHFTFPNATEKVPAHKCLLASSSTVFKAMFYGPLKEGDTVEIVDSNASAFAEFLQIFYLPNPKLTMMNIEEVVRLADKYDMMDCFEQCAELSKDEITAENVVLWYHLAIASNNPNLTAICEKHIQNKTRNILHSEMLPQCSRDVIDHILKLPTLQCDEADLFGACIEWAKASCQRNGLDAENSENLRNQLGPCFNSIRFGAMEGEGIGNILLNKVLKDMFTRDELADICLSKCIKNPGSQLFNHEPRLKPADEWDAENEIDCMLEEDDLYPDDMYFILKKESTWFSTNEAVLLGEIGIVGLYNGDDDDDDDFEVAFDVQVNEYSSLNFATDAPKKRLFSQSGVRSTRLKVRPPIEIRPHKFYEIRFLRNGVAKPYSYRLSWKPEVELDDNITIKFHQNPALYDNDYRSLQREWSI